MGFDLRRKKDGVSVSVFTWARAYALAICGGWEPRGTLPPQHLSNREKEAWPGAYDSSDGQVISDEDAKAMADALEQMMAKLCSPVAEVSEPTGGDTSLWRGDDKPEDYFSTESKRMVLKAIIDFLRKGECEIW